MVCTVLAHDMYSGETAKKNHPGVSDGAELIAMASMPVRPDLQSQRDELGVKVGVVAGAGAAVAKGWLQVFGAATVAVGVAVVLVQVGALVYEGIEGRKQKNKLQEYSILFRFVYTCYSILTTPDSS